MAGYPREWEAVQRDLAPIVAGGDVAALEAYALKHSDPPSRSAARGGAALASLVGRQITAAALKQILLATAAGATSGRVRFNLINGYVAQRLLFARDLEPVSGVDRHRQQTCVRGRQQAGLRGPAGLLVRGGQSVDAARVAARTRCGGLRVSANGR